MVDHLDRDAAALWLGKHYGGVTVEGGPGFRIDLGLQGGLQAFVGVVLTEEVGLPHEEAFAVVVGIDEPAGDVVGIITADLTSGGVEHVHTVDPHLDLIRLGLWTCGLQDVDIRLPEDHEQVAFAGVLEVLLHMQIRVHACLQDGQVAELAELGGVVLREEELNLRYVAVTRAKATCHSAQWSAPLFADLERFVTTNPRFLLLPTLAGFKGKDQVGEDGGNVEEEGGADRCGGNKGEQGSEGCKEEQVETDAQQAQPVLTLEPRQTDQPASPKTLQRLIRAVRHLSLVPERRKAEAVMSEVVLPCPTPAAEPRVLAALDASGGSDSDDPVLQVVRGVASPVSTGVVWQLGALEQSRVRVVVQHYRHRYPALDREWLLPALSELRLVAEPRVAVSRFVEQHQLGSAQALLERFLQGVGLWVVAE